MLELIFSSVRNVISVSKPLSHRSHVSWTALFGCSLPLSLSLCLYRCVFVGWVLSRGHCPLISLINYLKGLKFLGSLVSLELLMSFWMWLCNVVNAENCGISVLEGKATVKKLRRRRHFMTNWWRKGAGRLFFRWFPSFVFFAHHWRVWSGTFSKSTDASSHWSHILRIKQSKFRKRRKKTNYIFILINKNKYLWSLLFWTIWSKKNFFEKYIDPNLFATRGATCSPPLYGQSDRKNAFSFSIWNVLTKSRLSLNIMSMCVVNMSMRWSSIQGWTSWWTIWSIRNIISTSSGSSFIHPPQYQHENENHCQGWQAVPKLPQWCFPERAGSIADCYKGWPLKVMIKINNK